jgi:hypothetical protein
MDVLDRVQHWLPEPKKTTAFREAAGTTIDADEDQWRPLTQDSKRDLTPLTHARMQELAVYQWKGNPLANRIIELPLAFLLAKGVTVDVPDEEAKTWLSAFWNDPINRMDIKLVKKARELSIFGEQCWPTFVNEINGHVRLGYVDPSLIDKVITDPDNIEQPIGIVLKRDKKGRTRRLRVIINGPEDVFTERTRKIREDFGDGECFYYSVNDLSSANRGHSDMLSLMDWNDAYDRAMFGELDRWDYQRAFLWDVTLKGATEEQVNERARKIAPPAPNSVRVHNDQEEWSTVSPELQSNDTTTVARMFRTHIMGGATLPEHWFGAGGDVNRATAQAMDDPTFKMFTMRQTIWANIIMEVCSYAIHQRLLKGYGARPNEVEATNYVVSVKFPEMVSKDTTTLATALSQVVIAAGSAVTAKLLSQETAISLIAFMANQLGLDIDPAEELERAQKDAENQKTDDSFNDFDALGSDEPAGDAGDEAD